MEKEALARGCSVIASMLCLIAGLISGLSIWLGMAWITYTVPGSVLDHHSGDVIQLHHIFPQLFYTRNRGIEDDNFCFPDMSNEIWVESFGRNFHTTRYCSRWRGCFCLTLEEFYKPSLRATSCNSTTCYPVRVTYTIPAATELYLEDLHFAVRAVLITGVALCFAVCVLTSTTFGCKNPCPAIIATVGILAAGFIVIAVVAVHCPSTEDIRYSGKYGGILHDPFYGFVHNDLLLSATRTNYGGGFYMACSSMAILLVAGLCELAVSCLRCSVTCSGYRQQVREETAAPQRAGRYLTNAERQQHVPVPDVERVPERPAGDDVVDRVKFTVISLDDSLIIA